MNSSSRDQDPSASAGHWTLAIKIGAPKARFRWPWMPREMALGYNRVGLAAGERDGRAFIAFCPLERAFANGEDVGRRRPTSRDVVIWLDGENSAAQLKGAIDRANADRAASARGWRRVGNDAYVATYVATVAKFADGTGGAPSPPVTDGEGSREEPSQ